MKIDWIWMLIGLGNIYIGYRTMTEGGAWTGYEFLSGLAGSILVAAGLACLVASFRIKKKF